MPESRRHFSRRVNKALDDPNLQKALIHAMTGLRGRRNAAFESFDFAAGRADLKRRRKANLDRLPELLEQFTQRLAAVGGVVHLAANAAEARDIIGQLCWNAGSGLPAGNRMVVTKSKSIHSATSSPTATTMVRPPGDCHIASGCVTRKDRPSARLMSNGWKGCARCAAVIAYECPCFGKIVKLSSHSFADPAQCSCSTGTRKGPLLGRRGFSRNECPVIR